MGRIGRAPGAPSNKCWSQREPNFLETVYDVGMHLSTRATATPLASPPSSDSMSAVGASSVLGWASGSGGAATSAASGSGVVTPNVVRRLRGARDAGRLDPHFATTPTRFGLYTTATAAAVLDGVDKVAERRERGARHWRVYFATPEGTQVRRNTLLVHKRDPVDKAFCQVCSTWDNRAASTTVSCSECCLRICKKCWDPFHGCDALPPVQPPFNERKRQREEDD